MVRRQAASPATQEPAEDEVRARAGALLEPLRGEPKAAQLKEARALVLALRNLRAFEPMAQLAEALCRIDPDDASQVIHELSL